MRKNIIFGCLFFTLFITIFFVPKLFSIEKVNHIESIKEENIINNEQFAMYIENEEGEYVKYTDTNYFPTNYSLNLEKSYCVDTNEQTVEGVITYVNNKVTVTSNNTVYCTLYFTKDSAPGSFTFYLGGNTNPIYTSSTSTTAYLSWSDTDIAYYCVTNTEGGSDCTWQSASGNSATPSHTLTTGDGTKTAYAYIKDTSGNISLGVSDTIILDTEAPTSNSVLINAGAASTNSTSVTLTLSSAGASQMCISNTTSCSSWETYATSKSWTLTSANGTKTVYVWYRDAAGNSTSYVIDTITLDNIAPTVTASLSYSTITFTSNEAGTYCINSSSTASNVSSCIASGSVTANTAKSVIVISGGTYYVHVKDSNDNYGISSSLSVSLTAFGTYVKSAKTTGFNSTMEGGLYRYQGTTANNYVCFGTSTKSTCTGNTDAYMYRIIGVNSSGQVKLIKNEALNSKMQWYSDNTSNITWPNSFIYKNINGSSYLTNTTYMPSGWSSKIATISWKYGEFERDVGNGDTIYAIENAFTSTVSAKIALMYLHDYNYAYQSGGGADCFGTFETFGFCEESWIDISNCDPTAPVTYNETLMSRHPYDTEDAVYYVKAIAGGGPVNNSFTRENSIRPVFYLTTSVNYVSGSGTSTDPFIIS